MKRQQRIINGGEKFNLLTIVKEIDPEIQYDKGKPTRIRKVLCSCECGKSVEIRLTSVVTGYAKSCGCLTRKQSIKNLCQKTHGQSKSRLYAVWCGMKERCSNKNIRSYKDYGGRGIKVCDEWINNFESFRDWAVKNGEAKGLQIDRKDVNGNYEPSNCRFVTAKVNSNNRRKK